jgi:3-dehydroquinate synthetase
MTAVLRRELHHGAGVTELSVGAGDDLTGSELGDWVADRVIFVVSSEPIWRLHGERCLADLAETAAQWTLLEVADGERAKTLSTAERLWEEMLAAGGVRDSRLLTFGGGSICDVGAFVAGTFMRGIKLSHVPTTLLAQVDAAIGGKSAINVGAAKNSVGVFHQPDKVVSMTGLLETLPRRELRAGLFEAIKMAVLLDPDLLTRIERDLDDLLVFDAAKWVPVVSAAQRAKVGVVERDPLESGDRRVLNFGHTLGHALEAGLGFGSLLHGEAVAYGMIFALRLAISRGLDRTLGRRVGALLDRLDLPPLPRPSIGRLLELMSSDKKASREGVAWVLPTGLGAWEAVTLPADEVAAELARFVAQRCEGC